MNTPKLDIDKIADLARIDLTPGEKATYSAQLNDTLAHIDQLKQVDITDVPPTTHGLTTHNVWQEDIPQDPFPIETTLQNAPKHRKNMFAVPKVVE